MPKPLVRKIDQDKLSWMTTLMMGQEECHLTDVATSVPRMMIVVALAVDNLVVEE